MRIAALALITVLAACNPSAPSSGGDSLFPDLSSASYRAEAVIHGNNGQNLPVVMMRSGGKVRMELNTGDGAIAAIHNPDTNQTVTLMTRAGRTFAVQSDVSDYSDPSADWTGANQATRTGSCSVAGENGAEWTRDVNGTPHTACVTEDGIMLQAREGDRVTWETTSVVRGPQDAALFTVPEGVEVMDPAAMIGGLVTPGGAGNAQLCDTLRNAGAPADALSRAGC